MRSPRTACWSCCTLPCSLAPFSRASRYSYITQDTALMHWFQLVLGSTITRFALMHMIAVNIAAWIESTRLESDEMVHADAELVVMRNLSTPPSEISLNDAWTAVARVCAAKFWILASGQLFILWLCCGYAMEALRSGVEVGVKFVERKNSVWLSLSFGSSTVGLLAGEACFIALAATLFACVKLQYSGDYKGSLLIVQLSQIVAYGAMLLACMAGMRK